MGYTIEKGKNVIWTSKVFESDPYPFHDEGVNYTYFYPNLRGSEHIGKILASESEQKKKEFVSTLLGMPIEKIVLKSRLSHMKIVAKGREKRKNK